MLLEGEGIVINLKECADIAKELELPVEKVLQVLDRAAEISASKKELAPSASEARDVERLEIYKQDVRGAKKHRRAVMKKVTEQNQTLDRIAGLLEKSIRSKL